MNFLKSSATMIFWRGIIVVSGVITNIILARWLGPADRGLYAVILTSISLISLVFQFGIPEASIYNLSLYNQDLKNEYTSKVLNYVLIVSLIVIVVSIFLTLFHTPVLLCPVTFIILLNICSTFIRYFILSNKQYLYYNVGVFLDGLLLMLALVYIYITGFVAESNILVVIYLYLTSYFIGFLYSVYILIYKNNFILVFNFNKNINDYVYIMRTGFNFFMSTISGFISQKTVIYLIEFVINSSSVGIYSVANSLPNLFLNLPQQISTVLYTKISEKNNEINLLSINKALLYFILPTLLIMTIPFFYFADDIIVFIYGEEYSNIGVLVSLLFISAIFSSCVTVIYNGLAGLGYSRVSLNIFYMKIMSFFIFIPSLYYFSLTGLAYALIISSFLTFLYVYYYSIKKLSINIG